MIKRLRTKFIVLSMVSLFVLMFAVVAGMNIVNYISFVRDTDELLSLISDNRGYFPDFAEGGPIKLPPHMTPETPYQIRYFSVFIDSEGVVREVNTQKISSIDPYLAASYAAEALDAGEESGFIDRFRYASVEEAGGVRISFVDRGKELDSVTDFAEISVIMSTIGYIIISVFVIFISSRIIRPVAESYEKQKRFITDAGHEMKTPLTIISANVDLYEMERGECEYISEIRNECKKLSSLTRSLVYLAKLEEPGSVSQMIELPISDLASEAVASFSAPAQLEGKEIVAEISGLITLRANDEAMRRLFSILLDNAVKYSPDGTKIFLTLQKQGRRVVLTVENECKSPPKDGDLPRLFDRFYRADASRNSATGGHGIGLSTAAAITETHGGKIEASLCGTRLKITVELPIK